MSIAMGSAHLKGLDPAMCGKEGCDRRSQCTTNLISTPLFGSRIWLRNEPMDLSGEATVWRAPGMLRDVGESGLDLVKLAKRGGLPGRPGRVWRGSGPVRGGARTGSRSRGGRQRILVIGLEKSLGASEL